jgi:hypothetical protein
MRPFAHLPTLKHVLFGMLALALGVGATAAHAHDTERGELRVLPPRPDGTTVMSWRGKIAVPMAQQIRHAFEANKRQSKRIVFKLDSGGGSVQEGERVIEVLRTIKETHELETVVDRGGKCGSMCVFIYVQGQRRIGALASTWLFHEVSYTDPATKKITRLDRASWERLVDRYLRPAGVADAWIMEMKPFTVQSDYWQTGADLVKAKSGIIQVALGNQQERTVHQPGQPHKPTHVVAPIVGRPDGPRTPAPPTVGCTRYFPNIGAVISVPCT